MTESNQKPDAAVEDRRRSDREPLETHVTLELDRQTLTGRCDNVSQAGVLLFSDAAISVTVTIDGPDGPVQRTGRLARVQRMSDVDTGYAIEFDGV